MYNREELQHQPENPSERYPLVPIIFRCDCCGKEYRDWKLFLDHMELSNHRICYKCGHSVGGMKEYLNSEYVAERIDQGNIQFFKYKHIECPVGNPSKRGR